MDTLLTRLRERISRYDETGDQNVLMDPVFQEQVTRLYNKVVTERTDVPAMVVLAQWSVRRLAVLPDGQVYRDIQAARMLGMLLQQKAPDAITPDLAVLFEPAGEAQPSETVASILVSRFETHGDVAALNRAKVMLVDVIQTAPLTGPELASLLSALARVTVNEYMVGDKLTDVEAAIRMARQAIARMPADSPNRFGQVSMLVWALVLRHERTGDIADLDEAIRLGRSLLSSTPANSPQRPMAWTTLGAALIKRHERLGAVSDLDDGIEMLRQAVRVAPRSHPDRASSVATLGFSLMRRYTLLHDPQDADESVRLATQVAADAPGFGPFASMLLGNAAIVLAGRFGDTGDHAFLDEAVRLSKAAMASGKGFKRHQYWTQSNHAVIMFRRFDDTDALADLDEAIGAARAAMTAVAPDDPLRAASAGNLTMMLSVRARKTGDVSEIDEAVQVGRAALSMLSPGNPARIRALYVLAECLQQRHEQTGSAEDRDAAVGLFRAAVNTQSGSPQLRHSAAWTWYQTALKSNDLTMAAEAAASAVKLLPMLAWRGLDRSVQETRLSHASALTPDAAALAVISGRPEHAVELLEQGRSVLWSQALQTRTDLTDLRDVAPDLAARVDLARTALDQHESLGRRKHAEQWDALVREVRRLEGFGSFLAPTPFEELSQAALAGPVAIVNASPIMSHALIVTPGRVQAIDLDWLDYHAARQRAAVLLKAQQDAEANRNPVTRAHLRQSLASCVRWLWDTVAEPILSAVDTDRIYWCPTGPLTFLPLHAAGRYQKGRQSGRTVPDRVVSSYTTTLTALLRARTLRPTTGGLLAVGMPSTPGLAALPAVHDELSQITAAVPAASTLVGPAATSAAVLSALDRHAWVHFACHGTQNAAQPGESAIHLHDAPLSVTQLAANGLRNAELAYLSACHTATGSTKLADEAIHLTAALQTAGYRHVIGTQWSITDEHAATIAGAVYRNLPQLAPSAAVAEAIAPLRAAHPDRPEIWAPYIHTGP